MYRLSGETEPIAVDQAAGAPDHQQAVDVMSDQSPRLRNVWIGKRRTSLRLEAPMWDALEEVLVREGLSLDELITRLSRHCDGNLSSAVRTFLVSYFRAAATEQGHAGAGHGLFRQR